MRLKVSLPLDKASAIVDEALRLAREENMDPLTIVVLDAGGKIIAVKSEDGSGLLRVDIALGKAWAALGMGMSSRAIQQRSGGNPAFQNALSAASNGKFVPVPGGVLINDSDNNTIGSVGISGDKSAKDEYCAVGAIIFAGLLSEPAEPAPGWHTS